MSFRIFGLLVFAKPVENEEQMEIKERQTTSSTDLLPLVHNEVDGRLSDFSISLICMQKRNEKKKFGINRYIENSEQKLRVLKF
jgi:hypothetical protein